MEKSIPSVLFEKKLVLAQFDDVAADGCDVVLIEDETVVEAVGQVAVLEVLDLM